MYGITSSATSVSSHESTKRSITASTKRIADEMNCSRPHCTISAMLSMSAVMRATKTPAFSRSKKLID